MSHSIPYPGKREGGEVAKAIIESRGLDVCAVERFLNINLHREEGNVWPLGQPILGLLLWSQAARGRNWVLDGDTNIGQQMDVVLEIGESCSWWYNRQRTQVSRKLHWYLWSWIFTPNIVSKGGRCEGHNTCGLGSHKPQRVGFSQGQDTQNLSEGFF